MSDQDEGLSEGQRFRCWTAPRPEHALESVVGLRVHLDASTLRVLIENHDESTQLHGNTRQRSKKRRGQTMSDEKRASIARQTEPTTRTYPLLGPPPKEGQVVLQIECRLCGIRARAAYPWHGRPQGPQCQCNPNTWGNWRVVR